MLTINVPKGKTLDDMLDEYKLIMSREIIISVCEAIDRGVSKILVMSFIVPGCTVPFDVFSSRTYYREALEIHMKHMIETEEYELCLIAQEHIGILDNQKLLTN